MIAELRELRAEVTVVKHENGILRDDVRDLRERRTTFKWTERPDRCPECDSTCWISSGPDKLTCYHCWQAELADKAEAQRDDLSKALKQIATHQGQISHTRAIARRALARLGKETK